MQKFFFLSAPDNLFIQVTQFIKSNQTFFNQNQNINYHQQIYLLVGVMNMWEVNTQFGFLRANSFG